MIGYIAKSPYLILLTALFGCPASAGAVESEFSGRLTGWVGGIEDGSRRRTEYGLGYIPQVLVERPLDGNRAVDAEISLKNFLAGGGEVKDSYFKLYRLYGRYTTPQTETRLGLQQINFGPGFMLRALRWFDSLDPRDPLRLTDGVRALRFRYTAPNNANLWLWGLYGNDETTGYETIPTASGLPELGGRYQHPVPRGELAVTVHTREAEGSLLDSPDFRENRVALDGRWDIEIGLWFEAVLQQQKFKLPIYYYALGPTLNGQSTNAAPSEWTKIVTVGMDYTLGIGNGLYFLAEHMAVVSSDKAFGRDEDSNFSAVNLNYPISLFDNLSAICFYLWDQKEFLQYLSWQRTYNSLIINLSLFRYPDLGAGFAFGGPDSGMTLSGRGGRLMIILNH